MKTNFFIKLIVALAILSIFIFPFESGIAQAKTPIYFFYGDGCPYCSKVEPFVNQMQGEYPLIVIEKLEVYHNQDNAQLLTEKYAAFSVPYNEQSIPVIFINNKCLSGYIEIKENFKQEIGIYLSDGSISEEPQTELKVETDELNEIQAETTDSAETLTFWAVTGAALVDSINPCAIAVLVILLGALMLTKGKKRALLGGLAFTSSIYVSYFLFGFGIVYTLQISGLSFWFYRIIGIAAILIGIFNIKDFFWYGGGGFVMEIPRAWRPALKKLLNSVTSPLGAFFIGFVVILFELPCTGGPYLFVLGLLSHNEAWTNIVPLLLYYNLIFILPLLLITFMIYFGLSKTEQVNQWKDENIRLLHLIGGTIMIVLGIWVLLI